MGHLLKDFVMLANLVALLTFAACLVVIFLCCFFPAQLCRKL